MRDLHRILVDVDVHASHHPALHRAGALARATGAELAVTDVLAPAIAAREDPSAPPDEAQLDMIAARLVELAATVTGVEAHGRLLLGTPVAALLEEAERWDADLLVRDHARDLSAAGPRPYGPIDRELVRASRVPVLLVGPGVPASARRILVALPHDDAGSGLELSHELLDHAMLLAALDEATVTVLRVWSPFAERHFHGRASEEEIAAYVQQHREETEARLVDTVLRTGIGAGEVTLTVRRGRVEEVLPSFVVSEGIDLVLLGVTPRRPLARLLFGSTTDRVLRRLPCSVLAVPAPRRSH